MCTFTKRQFEEVALVLENERDFYHDYLKCKTYDARRGLIDTWIWARRNDLPVSHSTVEDRDQLRRYFDDRYEIPQTKINKYAHIPSVWDHIKESELIDYSKLPDGTRFRLKNGKVVTKGVYDGPLRHLKPKPPVGEFAVWIISECGKVAGHISLRDCGVSTSNSDWTIVEVLPTNEVQSTDQPVTTTPQENLMSAIIIEITTKTLVNGADIATMSDSEVYNLIAAQEAKE